MRVKQKASACSRESKRDSYIERIVKLDFVGLEKERELELLEEEVREIKEFIANQIELDFYEHRIEWFGGVTKEYARKIWLNKIDRDKYSYSWYLFKQLFWQFRTFWQDTSTWQNMLPIAKKREVSLARAKWYYLDESIFIPFENAFIDGRLRKLTIPNFLSSNIESLQLENRLVSFSPDKLYLRRKKNDKKLTYSWYAYYQFTNVSPDVAKYYFPDTSNERPIVIDVYINPLYSQYF